MSDVWKQIAIHPVGGIVQVGYAENSDLILVLSHNGRGIFDCLTGQKIARDRNDYFEFFDESTLVAKGFEQLNELEIKTAGLFGGNLSKSTQDGWTLSIKRLNGMIDEVYLSSKEDEIFIENDEVSEIRAFGFSNTGKSFVVATTSDLTIFSR
ncbi:MAG: hypothetical protein ABI686_13310 [Acidobacteriota bacterium]